MTKVRDMLPYAALTTLDDVLRELMRNPGISQQHKAKLVQVGTELSEMRRAYMPKRTPVTVVDGLAKGRLFNLERRGAGWMKDWEAANA